MKKVYALLIAAISVLSSCGTTAKYASSGDGQRFQDGIYDSSPGFMGKAAKADLQTGTDALVAKTKESEIYLFGDRKDTIMIPQNMSATIRYDKESGGTSVTVADNPYDWRNNIDPWGMYGAWDSWNIGWHYRGPWAYSGYWGRYDPWYAGWYSPWHYTGWYDPWYSYGWHDPWYGGYWGWHDPYWHHHHYCGWYGGWGPHFPGGTVVIKENKWHGPRNRTGSDRVFTSNVSTRGGIGTSGRTGRAASVQGSRAGSGTASSVTSGRVSAVPSRSISRAAAGQTSRPASSASTAAVRTVSRQVQQARPSQSAGTSANYRRPTVQAQPSGNHVSAAVNRSAYSRSTTSSGYDRSSSTSSYQSHDRSSSSSSYNRSSSSGAGRSGYSGSSSSVSRGGSSGGYSRSSGSSGGRR